MYKVVYRKKNHRFRGPVESGKMNDNIIEIINSLININNSLQKTKTAADSFADSISKEFEEAQEIKSLLCRIEEDS